MVFQPAIETMQDAPGSHLHLRDENRYRLLVDAVADYAIYMLDASGVISSWNTGAQRFKGYRADEIIGQHFSVFYTPEDRATNLPARALVQAADKGNFESEGWRVRKDGSRFWAHVVIDPIRTPAGELIGYAKVTRDLSERKAAEDALKRSQEQFRLLVNGVTDYAIFMLDTEGRVNSWNVGAQRIKGYREDEILGRHFSEFYRPEDRDNGDPARALAMATKIGRFESEGWRVRKDGSHFWANVVIDSIRDESGALIGFAKVTRDVTERRQTQHALEIARESLFHSQKLDAIGQLTGGVAHDFNNLLMVIVSSLELVRRRIGDAPKVVRLLENAMQGAMRGASLTQRMLAFARRQDLKPVPVEIAALVNGMLDLLQRSIGPSIPIETRLPEGLKPVRVDPNQLELAVLNLVVNARDAMPHGGSLSIEADEVVVGEATRVKPGTYIRLSITDSGEGMDDDTLARAAEPFFTTKGVGRGTGLGLSMVDGLVSQSGGQLVLRSTKGAGTTAEIWLPVSSEAPAVAQTPAVEAPHPMTRRLTVLVVDDDSLVLASTLELLEELGHATFGATSAQEAIRVMRQQNGVQLVLTDHAMPKMTGAELLRALHAEWPGVGLILATGYADLGTEIPPSVVRLNKPFGHEQLERAIAVATRHFDRAAVSLDDLAPG
jgi:PAS domain S-box-containing protein